MWLVYGWPPCSREINQRTTFCNTFLNVLVAYGIGFVGLVGRLSWAGLVSRSLLRKFGPETQGLKGVGFFGIEN